MSREYLIMYNAGYGKSYEAVECESQEKADEMARDAWLDNMDGDYSAVPMTDRLREDYIDE